MRRLYGTLPKPLAGRDRSAPPAAPTEEPDPELGPFYAFEEPPTGGADAEALAAGWRADVRDCLALLEVRSVAGAGAWVGREPLRRAAVFVPGWLAGEGGCPCAGRRVRPGRLPSGDGAGAGCGRGHWQRRQVRRAGGQPPRLSALC